MPMYPFVCAQCKKEYDVLKPFRLYDENEPCPDCGNPGQRVYTPLVWKPFIGSLTYDRRNNFPGGYIPGGTTSQDLKNMPKKDW